MQFFGFISLCVEAIKCNGGGHSPEKGVRRCAALKAPFSCLSCHSQDPQLRHKFTHKTLIWKRNVTFPLKNQTFLENMAIFSSRSSNLAAILQNISSTAPVFLRKICSQNPTFQGNVSTHKSPSSEIRTAHTYLNGLGTILIFFTMTPDINSLFLSKR